MQRQRLRSQSQDEEDGCAEEAKGDLGDRDALDPTEPGEDGDKDTEDDKAKEEAAPHS